MPMKELEELESLLKQPLPGGRGFQEARQKRIDHLHEKVIQQLLTAIKDTYSHQDLATMYLEEMFGDEFGRPRIVLRDDFKEIWKDFFDEGDDEENTGE